MNYLFTFNSLFILKKGKKDGNIQADDYSVTDNLNLFLILFRIHMMIFDMEKKVPLKRTLPRTFEH